MTSIRHEGIHCTLMVDRPTPGVVVVELSGHDVGEFGDVAFQELAKDVAGPAFELFIDAGAVQGASIDVSNDWAQWLRRHRGSFRGIHMLTGSRFIQLTAGFVRRFADLGEVMRLYTERAAFDGALTEAVRNATRHDATV